MHAAFSQRWGAAVRVLPTHLEEVPPLMHLLDVFICKDAARSLELAGALPGTSGDNWFMHAVGAKRKRRHTKPPQWVSSLVSKGDAVSNRRLGGRQHVSVFT